MKINWKIVSEAHGLIEITNCASCPFKISGPKCLFDDVIEPENAEDDPNYPALGCTVVALKKIVIQIRKTKDGRGS